MNVAKSEIKLDLSQTLNNNKTPQQINESFRAVSDMKGQTNNVCKIHKNFTQQTQSCRTATSHFSAQ